MPSTEHKDNEELIANCKELGLSHIGWHIFYKWDNRFDLTASGNDMKCIAKNIVNQLLD